MKILIIEDETSLSNSIASYLKADNYLCEIAGNYKMALDKIESFDYDCILFRHYSTRWQWIKCFKRVKKIQKNRWGNHYLCKKLS